MSKRLLALIILLVIIIPLITYIVATKLFPPNNTQSFKSLKPKLVSVTATLPPIPQPSQWKKFSNSWVTFQYPSNIYSLSNNTDTSPTLASNDGANSIQISQASQSAEVLIQQLLQSKNNRILSQPSAITVSNTKSQHFKLKMNIVTQDGKTIGTTLGSFVIIPSSPSIMFDSFTEDEAQLDYFDNLFTRIVMTAKVK